MIKLILLTTMYGGTFWINPDQIAIMIDREYFSQNAEQQAEHGGKSICRLSNEISIMPPNYVDIPGTCEDFVLRLNRAAALPTE